MFLVITSSGGPDLEVGAVFWWGSVMIQGAESWTGLIGIIDIYYFRAPSEKFSGSEEFRKSTLSLSCSSGIHHSNKQQVFFINAKKNSQLLVRW